MVIERRLYYMHMVCFILFLQLYVSKMLHIFILEIDYMYWYIPCKNKINHFVAFSVYYYKV